MTDFGVRLVLLGHRAVGLNGGRNGGGRRLLRVLIKCTGQVPAIAVELTAILILPRRRRYKTRSTSDDVEESPDVRRRKLLVVILYPTTGEESDEKNKEKK